MSEYEIKLSSTLKFDSEKEKDIIQQVEGLASRKKLGEFVSNAIRVALDNPELLKKSGKSLMEYNMTDERVNFFKSIDKQTQEMQVKVDKVFDMTYQLYMLAIFGKRMGLEQKATNIVQTQFILQRQVDELCLTLGVSGIGHLYESNKLNSFEKKAKDVLEYIISAYDGEVSELMASIGFSKQIQNNEQFKINNSETGRIIEANVSENKNGGIVSYNTDTPKKEQMDKTDEQIESKGGNQDKNSELLINNKEDDENEDEVIDFGAGADWGALNMFVGD